MLVFSKTRNWLFLSQHSALIWSCWFVSLATGICSVSCCTHMPLQTHLAFPLILSVFPSHFPNLTTFFTSFPGTQQYPKSWRNFHRSRVSGVSMGCCWAFRGQMGAAARWADRQRVLRGCGAWASGEQTWLNSSCVWFYAIRIYHGMAAWANIHFTWEANKFICVS